MPEKMSYFSTVLQATFAGFAAGAFGAVRAFRFAQPLKATAQAIRRATVTAFFMTTPPNLSGSFCGIIPIKTKSNLRF